MKQFVSLSLWAWLWVSPAIHANAMPWVWVEMNLNDPIEKQRVGVVEVIQINHAVSFEFEGMGRKQALLCTVNYPDLECSDREQNNFKGFAKKSRAAELGIKPTSRDASSGISTYLLFVDEYLLLISQQQP